MKFFLTCVSLLILMVGLGFSQYIPESSNNKAIVEFLDELSSTGAIDALSVVKPYGNKTIYTLLQKANSNKSKLSLRQKLELTFYLKAYSFDWNNNDSLSNYGYKNTDRSTVLKKAIGIGYRDSLFKVTIKPIIGGLLYINSKASVQNRWWGASFSASIGDHFSMYTTLSDHWETQALALNTYLTPIQGGKYKNAVGRTGGEYSDVTGGLCYAWKWGHIGFVYDRFNWGSGYNGTNLFSGRTTPMPQITLQLKPARWFEFNYVHAWLSSDIIDSIRSFTSGNGNKNIYYEKYLAANFFTFIPWHSVRLSIGNSVIYSGTNAYPGFLIPTLFFRSVDENYSYINNNSQLFFDLSLQPWNHFHFYSSVYIDDFRLSRITNSSVYNLSSVKAGLRITGLPKNIVFTAEYTNTTPITYKHKIAVLSFATNNYNLGHYLRDNSEELFAEIQWKPIQCGTIYISYLNARHGNEYQYTSDEAAVSWPILKDNIWKNTSITAGLNYELFAGTSLKTSILFSNITSMDADGHTAAYYLDMFTPTFMQGKNVTLSGGFVIGF